MWKFGSNGACGSVDDGDVNALEASHCVAVSSTPLYLVSAVPAFERPLEVIVGRQQCGYGGHDCIGVSPVSALAPAALAEVVVLRRHAEMSTIVQARYILASQSVAGFGISLSGPLRGAPVYLPALPPGFVFCSCRLCLRLQEITDFRLFHLNSP